MGGERVIEVIAQGTRLWLDPEPDSDNEFELQMADDYHDGYVTAYLTVEQAHALGKALLAVGVNADD